MAALPAASAPAFLGVFLISGHLDRIDLGRIGLLLDLLRVVLGLLSATGFGGSASFSTGFSTGFGGGSGAEAGYDFLLFGDLADVVIHRCGVGDLLDQRLRLVLLAGLDAGGDPES